MKITSSSGIDKAVYHNSTYLFVLQKDNEKVLKFHIAIHFVLKHAAPLLLSFTVPVKKCYTSFKILE